VDLAEHLLLIHATDCVAPKATSTGEIPTDEKITNLLNTWKSCATDRFVVERVEPNLATDGHH